MRLLKLVRDGIPRMFGDAEIVYEPLSPDEKIKKLRKKLVEEAYEYQDDPSIGELADVYEVFLSLCEHDLTCRVVDVIEVAHAKAEERGKFDDGMGMYLRERS